MPPGAVLHVSPHPDDELIGAPAALFALRDAGHGIFNLACGLGRPEEHDRRRRELREATRRARFELILPDGPAALSGDEDPGAAHRAITPQIEKAIAEVDPVIVVSPQPHDRHRAHEVVAGAVRDVIEGIGTDAPRWWMWGLWADLSIPTIGIEFGEERLEEILAALEAHGGELRRNDYRRLIRGRSEMYASRGPELLFGFGSEARAGPFVEVLTEAVCAGGRWLLGRAHWLEPGSPLEDPTEVDIGEWLHEETLTQRYGPPGLPGAGARS